MLCITTPASSGLAWFERLKAYLARSTVSTKGGR